MCLYVNVWFWDFKIIYFEADLLISYLNIMSLFLFFIFFNFLFLHVFFFRKLKNVFERDGELKNACVWDKEFGNGISKVMIIMSTCFFFLINTKNYNFSVWLVYIERKILIEGK